MASLKIVAAEDAALVSTSVPLGSAVLSIGREPDNALVLTDPLMSRHHARIQESAGGFVLEDLGSSNGVWVNGERVKRRTLTHGDRVRIGRTELVVEAPKGGEGRPRCAACGDALEADARFCPACGAKVQPAARPAPPPTLRPGAAPPAAQPGSQLPRVVPRASAPTPRRRWPLWLGLGLGLAAIAAGGVLLLLHLRRPAPGPGAPAGGAPAPGPELRAALAFRDAVRDAGWDAAVQRVATPEAARRLASIGATIWPDPAQTAGWVYLIETALNCPGAPRGTSRPVAFYHPFSDVLLITAWRARSDERVELVDAELLMGDFVRRRGPPRLESGPPAEYRALYRPLAVGLWAAETVRAYEGLLGAAAASEWRAALPALGDEGLLQANRVGAGLQIAANLAPLGVLALPAPDARDTRQVRGALRQLLEAVRAGRTAAALSRARVLDATRDDLARLPFEAWERFKPVSYDLGSRGSLVVLSKSDQTDRYLALLFARDGDAARLARVDLLSFNVFYKGHAELKRRVGL